MTTLDAFVTFGLPAIALVGTAVALYAQSKATDRLRAKTRSGER